jgi:hypothetical protein
MLPKSVALKKRIKENRQKYKGDSTINTKCLFPQNFTPNPGAQEKFFTEFFSTDQHLPHPFTTDIGRRVAWYRAGLNGGKSFAGAAFSVACALKDPEARGLVTANSYGQLKTSSLVALAEFCKHLTAKRIADNRFCTIFGAPVLVLSAESFTGRTDKSQEVGRGLQVRWFWGDEYAYANESAFNTMYSRLGRGPGTLPGIGFLTSSINRNSPYNWAYDLFDAPNRDKGSVDYFVSVGGSSAENLHADPEYVRSMMATLTPELIKIELLGEYATVAKGIIFNTFVRAIHLLQGADARLCEYDPRYPLHLSFDFNHSPACAIAAQQVDGELRILREWYKVDSDTFELSDDVAGWVLTEWTAAHNATRAVFIHGDASGNQKTANSRTTNWEIVWDALKARGIVGDRCYGASNPDIQDSVNGLKIALKNDKIFLHGVRCLELSKDLESLRWKGTDIDKKDLKRSHVQDCLRYLVWDLWPYLPSAAKQAMRGSARNIRGVVA